jgi:oligoendopeptidase F
MGSIYSQIMCFNFELELHKQIRSKGYLNKDEIKDLYIEVFSKASGPNIKYTDADGYYYVDWPHIRQPFYTFTYAFGRLVSKALVSNYYKDKNYIYKINEFLKTGTSDTPENTFKKIGIDLTKKDFFESGLNLIREDLNRLEQLIK